MTSDRQDDDVHVVDEHDFADDPGWVHARYARDGAKNDIAELAGCPPIDEAATNDIAVTARLAYRATCKAISPLEQELEDAWTALTADREGPEADVRVTRVITAAYAIHKTVVDALHALKMAATPDAVPPEIEAPSLPPVHSWMWVVNQSRTDMMRWLRTNFETERQYLIMCSSPGSGKTESQIYGALTTTAEGLPTIYAVRDKDMLRTWDEHKNQKPGELTRRMEDMRDHEEEKLSALGHGIRGHRLHVITGRDETNCKNFENVQIVQQQGWSPAHTVCRGCEYNPRVIVDDRIQPCEYYASRKRARSDYDKARKTQSGKYPLILTTHAAVAAAADAGGGIGEPWWANTKFIFRDEDPTDAHETFSSLLPNQLNFKQTDTPANTAATSLCRLLRGAMKIAVRERTEAMKPCFTARARNQVHNKYGSTYAGRPLAWGHDSLLERALAADPQFDPNVLKNGKPLRKTVRGILVAAADKPPIPEPGSLFGIDEPTLHCLVPAKALSELAEALVQETAYAERYGQILIEKVNGDSVIKLNDLRHDTAYRTRLACDADESWMFAIHKQLSVTKLDANMIFGDATAHIPHYRRLLDVPADTAASNLTIIRHLCESPPGVLVARTLTKSNIGYLTQNEDNLETHLEHVAEILSLWQGWGLRFPLIVGHSQLKDTICAFMEKNNNFGFSDWKWLHHWGVRGRDQFKDCDCELIVSAPIGHVGALVDTANVRSFFLAEKAGQSTDLNERFQHLPRISLNAAGGHIGQMMRSASTHHLIREEWERKSENELEQQVHRTRLLRLDPSQPELSRKVVFIMDRDVEMSQELLAASSTILKPIADRGQFIDVAMEDLEHLCGFVTADEMLRGVLAIIEWCGLYTPKFAHALTAIPWSAIMSNSGPDFDRLNELQDDWTEFVRRPLINRSEKGPANEHRSLGRNLIQRVLRPVPGWRPLGLRMTRSRIHNRLVHDLDEMVDQGELNRGKLGRDRFWMDTSRSADETMTRLSQIVSAYDPSNADREAQKVPF